MSEVTDLLKAWMEETRKLELRHEEERRRYEQERAEEKRRYEQERAEEILRYEELVRGLTTGRSRRVVVGPESLKLTKLGETGRHRSLFDELRESSRSSWGGAR